MRIGIYIRVSTDEQAEDGYSLAAQERICRAFVESRSWSVGAVYADEGLSGTRADRPQLQRLREDVRLRRIQGIVVHKLDRLARNLRLTLDIIEELKRCEAAFVSVTEQLDFSTPIGWAMFQVQGVFAEMYSRNLSTETAKGLTEKARRGLWVGPVPFGYERDGATLRPSDDAPTVRQIFELYSSRSHSFGTIADALNRQGARAFDWRTQTRHWFGRETIRTIIRNPAYIGVVRSGGITYPGQHPPLIATKLWEAACAIREERKVKQAKYSAALPKRGGLLTEIAHCYMCDDRMWYSQSGRKSAPGKYYVCRGKNTRTCDAGMSRAEAVEQQVLDLLRALTLPADWQAEVLARAARLINTPKPRVISLLAVQEQLKRLALVYAAGDIDTTTYQQERARLKELLATAPAPPATLDLVHASELLGHMAELVDAATPDEQRALIRQVFAKVWVERRIVKAVAPTTAFKPLVLVLDEVCTSLGCLTGFEPATS